MKIKITVIVALFFVFSAAAATDNNCHNAAANDSWKLLMRKNAHQPEWQDMNAYRNELCAEIDNGDITLEEANKKFEELRDEKFDIIRARLKRLEELLKKLEKTYNTPDKVIG